MLESLVVISVSVTILSLVFLFLYLKKYQELYDIKLKLHDTEKREQNYKEMQRIREDFLAMLIHEFRSPLAVIRGSADLILKEVDALDKDQIFELLKQIQSSSTDLLDMVNDMMDVSKLEAGRYELFVKQFDINRVLTEESKRYYALVKEHNEYMEMELDRSIPKFSFDADKIKQVMNNLISNAIKFTPAGGHIYVTSKLAGDCVRITVADTGMGIPDDLKPRLFHKFVQGRENGVRHEKGTGLGLVIVKGIIEAHGGSIWVEDNTPKGAKFVFTLPVKGHC
jgi:two-component system, sporulation sensor kinase E